MTSTAATIGAWAIGVFSPSEARLERLAAWFHTEYGSLVRFAGFVCGDRALAEDLVQEAFVRVYRAGGRVDDITFPGYARRTIVNLARSGHRRRALERRMQHERERWVDPPDAGARDEVWSAVLTLSPRQRAVVALRFYEDLSEKETAAALEMSAGAVKKHADRALAKLREILGRER